MEIEQLYALAVRLEQELARAKPTSAGGVANEEDASSLNSADIFSLLEYLWARGVDLRPALAF